MLTYIAAKGDLFTIWANICLQKLFDMKFKYNSNGKLSKNVQTILDRIEQ